MVTKPYCYDHPRPAVAADVCMFAHEEGGLTVLLIKRRHDPYQGMWALPGGFVEEDETTEACAARELAEETGIEAKNLRLVGVYSAPGRDPRGRVISVAYLSEASDTNAAAVASSDAAVAAWVPVRKTGALAFDHARIIADALRLIEP